MAVTVNAFGGQSSAAVNTIAAPITVNAGANTGAAIHVLWRDVLSSILPSTVQSVTLSGFGAATFVQLVGSTAGTIVETYVAVGGSAGAQTCTVTWDDGAGGSSVLATVGVQAYDGVNQATPVGAINTGAATSNNPSVTVAGTISGSQVSNGMMHDNVVAATPTVAGGATQNLNVTVGSAAQGRIRNCISRILSAGGNVTMSWTITAARAWASSVVEILEASSTSVRDPILSPGIVPFPR